MKTFNDYDLLPISKFVKIDSPATLNGRRHMSRKSMKSGCGGSLTQNDDVRLQNLDHSFSGTIGQGTPPRL